MDTFRVRLNCVDYYQAPPTDFDPPIFGKPGLSQSSNGPTLPVIRVFGSTETGQKVCAHVHGALPYLYVEYRGSLERSVVNAYIQQFRASIDHALAVSYRRNNYEKHVVYVGHITLVKGVPFFGYHVGYRYFLKVYLLNPNHMTRFADLLYQGAVMGQPLQPFEAHLQYLAQWMCDYNLYGCAYMDCKRVKFRGPTPDYYESGNVNHKWHSNSIPGDCISDPSLHPRQSHCSLEVDVRVQDILNREVVGRRDLHHDFIERFQHLKPEEKLVNSLAGLWADETRRRKLRMGLTDPSSSPFPPEVLISMSADLRNTDKAGWIHEDEYRRIIETLVEQEKQSSNSNVSFDDFITPDPRETSIPSALESVEDLFHENLMSLFQSSESSSSNEAQFEAADNPKAFVDEKNIPKFDSDEFPYESDEDIAREIAISQHRPKSSSTSDTVPSDAVKKVTVAGSKATMDGGREASDSPASEVDTSRIEDTHDEKHKANEQMDGTEVDDSREPVENLGKIYANALGSNGSTLGAKRSRPADIDSAKATSNSNDNISPREDRNGQRKRARFAEENGFHPTYDDQRNEFTKPKHSQDSSTPPASQLSQSSIKAKHSDSNSTRNFSVTKNLHSETNLPASDDLSSERLKDSSQDRSDPTSSESKAAPNLTETESEPSRDSRSASPSKSLFALARNLDNTNTYLVKTFGRLPPSAWEVSSSLVETGHPDTVYQDAFYSNERDVPERSRDYAGREFKLESNTVPYLPTFDPSATSLASFGAKPPTIVDFGKQDRGFRQKSYACNLRSWEIAHMPPSFEEVENWMTEQKALSGRSPSIISPINNALNSTIKTPQHQDRISQVEGPTQKNQHGFKYSQKQKSTSVRHETQYMSTMSLEVHVNTRNSLVPDPEHDEISCIFWCLRSDEDGLDDSETIDGSRVGILVLGDQKEIGHRISKETGLEVDEEETELDLINRMVDIVRKFDPDVLTGYEVHNGSWGYLIERARLKFEYNLCDEFSRMMAQSHGRFGKQADRWGFEHTSTIRVTGRHMINIWRAMRGEVNLLQYTMENLAFHLIHKRIPHYSFKDLTDWYKSGSPRDLAKVLYYFVSRVQMDLEILEANELIPRTSEQARLIGVDFFSVFSRGSQFKVESFMFRIAKPENFLLVSPSKKQVGGQNALECLPLVMEPQSDFYNSPLLVLDFQSLYPSIMIAYNYCYSTCLGRCVSWRGQNKLGFANFNRQPRLLELVKDSINIAPNGIMYVKPEMRKSLLAKMLGEILESRVMVKSGMKVDLDDRTLQQLLNNRQLALKLMANVTYGYTSASFSGRMPCTEIADSIVQTARETLEKTIAFIHSVDRWNAEVVYGDTDSLFVYLKGRTREQAFAIGDEIAKEVTSRNPRPIKLKFEKVYHPCVLLAKKRYVGFKYESPQQVEPEFDAKGIETVRRDGTPAEQKIEEKALKLLFRSSDLSQVKSYFQRQCAKIMSGRISIQDFCFAKEVKLGTYADKGPPPPGALISTKRMLADPRMEPQYGERVPYVVITGAPGARLIDRCVAPEILLQDDSTELDAEYYISKNLIPPLERIFNLVGANVRQWYDEMPKIQRIRDLHVTPMTSSDGQNATTKDMLKKTLESYMKSSHCLVCRMKLPAHAKATEVANQPRLPLCKTCVEDPPSSLYELRNRLRVAQKKLTDVERVCRSCAALCSQDEVKCDSKDCPVFYSRVRAKGVEARSRRVMETVVEALEETADDNDEKQW